MREFLLETNKQNYLEYFQINRQKFITRRLLFALLSAILYALFAYSIQSPLSWSLIGFPIAVILGYKIPYLELMNKKSSEDLRKQYLFPTFLRYFIALIDTKGNVYQTLKAVVPYINEPIKSELEKLIKNFEEESVDNREAFMEFADSIGSPEARLVMTMIYEFNKEGINKDDIRELQNLVEELQENKTNELIEYKVNKMDRYATPALVYTLAYIFAFTILVQYAYFLEIL